MVISRKSSSYPNNCSQTWHFEHFIFLPPANEVWGKIIFSEARISHSVNKGVVSVWCHFLSGCLVPSSFRGWVFVRRGSVRETPRTVKSGWYASNGMLSCYLSIVRWCLLLINIYKRKRRNCRLTFFASKRNFCPSCRFKSSVISSTVLCASSTDSLNGSNQYFSL